MSIHPSLHAADKSKKQRSVLKRAERIRIMAEKEQWKEGDDVYRLPKIKTIRIKIKKEKAEKAETTAAETTGAPAAGAAAAKETPKAAAKGAEKK